MREAVTPSWEIPLAAPGSSSIRGRDFSGNRSDSFRPNACARQQSLYPEGINELLDEFVLPHSSASSEIAGLRWFLSGNVSKCLRILTVRSCQGAQRDDLASAIARSCA